MEIIKMVVRFLTENTYIYFDNKNDALIIDPGSDFKKIKNIIDKFKLNIRAILLTHGHIDHIGAVEEVKLYTGASVYCHEDEKDIIENFELNLSKLFKKKVLCISADYTFKDEDIFELGDIKLKVIHTPGHTKGSVCYYDFNNKNIFTGDTLFKGCIGRTDFPTGDSRIIKESIKNKLLILEDDIKIFSGHGEETTIGYERDNINLKF